MSISPINYNGSVAVDLSRIKCIKISQLAGEQHALLFELNDRVVYSKHPETGDWEKEMANEVVIVEYDSYDMAQAYFREWVESWQDFNLQK